MATWCGMECDELSTCDGLDRLLSKKAYPCDEVVEKAGAFRSLSWQDAQRRRRRLRL
jgi:hypothetical protein